LLLSDILPLSVNIQNVVAEWHPHCAPTVHCWWSVTLEMMTVAEWHSWHPHRLLLLSGILSQILLLP